MWLRPHTSAYVSIRQHTSAYVSIRQHTSAYVSIRQHTSAYVSIRQHIPEVHATFASARTRVIQCAQKLDAAELQHPSGVSICTYVCTSKASKLRTCSQLGINAKLAHTSAYVSIRQHTSAYVSIPAGRAAADVVHKYKY
jgi:hypothetical protein